MALVTQNRQKKPAFDLSAPSTFVKIHVYERYKQTTFFVHKNALCHYIADYCLDGGGPDNEDGSGILEVAETLTEAHIFGIFLNWMYTQKIEKPGGERLELVEKAKLFCFATWHNVEELAVLLRESILDLPDEPRGEILDQFGALLKYLPVGHVDLDQIVVSKAVKVFVDRSPSKVYDVLKATSHEAIVSFGVALLQQHILLRKDATAYWRQKHKIGASLPAWLSY